MTDELNNLDLFLDDDNGDSDLLGELDALKGLLSEPAANPDDDIPVLSDVVAAEKKPAPNPLAGNPFVPPPRPTERPTERPTAAASAPTPAASLKEKDLETMVDRIIDKEMPRIRVELKRVLLAELRMRGILK